MFKKTVNSTKKRALFVVLIAAAVIIALIFLRMPAPRGVNVSDAEGRIMFLRELGWEVDAESESCREVLIPEEFGEVMEQYNELQLKQGYDLSKLCGKLCTQYSYRITNYPGHGGDVYATLYISGRRVVGGDIHSAAVDGFMHALTKQ